MEIHETQGKCIEDAKEPCVPLGWAKGARILMKMAKAGGIGKKRSWFDIKKSDFSRRQDHPLVSRMIH